MDKSGTWFHSGLIPFLKKKKKRKKKENNENKELKIKSDGSQAPSVVGLAGAGVAEAMPTPLPMLF